MARLHRTKTVNVLTFEEKTRFTNFFMLLVEIDVRLPKTTKTEARKHVLRSFSKVGRTTKKTNHMPIIKQYCYMRCINNKNFPPCSLSKTARRDLFINQFMYAIS